MKKIDLSFRNPYEALKPYEGQTLKYPEICAILNVERKTGKGKQLQLSKWQMFVDMPKDGQKYYINKVYTEDDELTLLESHGAFSTYFAQHIVNMFRDILKQGKEPRVVLTNRDILVDFIVSNKYFEHMNTPFVFAYEEYSLTKDKGRMDNNYRQLFNDVIRDSYRLFQGTYPIFKEIIRSGLKSLESQRIAEVKPTYKLYNNTNGLYDADGHACSVEEHSRVLTCENKAIERFNNLPEYTDLKAIWQLRTRPKYERNVFKKILEDEISREFRAEGYNSRARAYEIVFAQDETLEKFAMKFDHTPLYYNVKEKCQRAITNVTRRVEEQWYDTYLKK